MKSIDISRKRNFLWSVLLTAVALAGGSLIFSGRLAVPPISYIPPGETAIQLLAPLSGIVSWAAAKWTFLPKFVMPLLALAALALTRRLFKTSGNFLFIVA